MKPWQKCMLVLGVILCFVAFFAGVATLGTKGWWNETPAEKAAAGEQKMQQEVILSSTKGDLVEMDNGRLIKVGPAPSNVFWDVAKMESQYRKIKRVIKKTDPDYPTAAIKFINQ